MQITCDQGARVAERCKEDEGVCMLICRYKNRPAGAERMYGSVADVVYSVVHSVRTPSYGAIRREWVQGALWAVTSATVLIRYFMKGEVVYLAVL